MKKKYIVVILTVLILAIAAVGGTLASGYVESKKKLQASISEKSLAVSIVDANNEKVKEEESLDSIVPGGEIVLNRSVTNPTVDGYDIYARVSMYYTWDTLDDEEVFEDSVFSLLLQEKSLVINTDYETAVNFQDWLIVESEPGVIVMYYTKPIAPGETVCFLEELKFDSNMDNKYAGAKLTLDYEVDAVQASKKNPDVSKKAIAAEWGVFVEIEDSVIVSVSESRAEKSNE